MCLKEVGGVVGGAFGGPAGAMIGSSLGGMLQGPGDPAGDPAAVQETINRQKALAQKKAYDEMIQRGQTQMDTGEQQFLTETSQAPKEFQAAQAALTNKTSAGYNELKSGLAQAGVRGGQAGTSLRRGAGDLQQQLDTMAFNEAQQRQQQKAGYFSSKAGRGQAGVLSAGPAPAV